MSEHYNASLYDGTGWASRAEYNLANLPRTFAPLKGVEFDLPVLETIRQMHERLDGTGYPDGLAGPAISRTALILGACDVFCARIEPRSYRSGIDPQAALAILQQNDTRYDRELVSALCDVVQSVAGEKLIASIDIP